jgi:hypothetical protein
VTEPLDETLEQRAARRLQQEYQELELPHVRMQQQIDRWWQSRRDFEQELSDVYFVGGFMEYRSHTPSFHKGKRDSDS